MCSTVVASTMRIWALHGGGVLFVVWGWGHDGALELDEIYPVILYVIGLLAGLNRDELKTLLNDWKIMNNPLKADPN